MYSYPGSGQYARPPGGFGPPPGMAAPGVGPPPGLQVDQAQQAGPPGRFPPSFQANMPNINFNAPVIRLGTTGGGQRQAEPGRREGPGDRPGRMGIGAQDSRRQGEAMSAPLAPPTKDETVRTIFIGGITEGVSGGESMERILRAAGSLRRWTRATDADDKPCRFGFAEYEDPDSLATAIDVLKEVEVPVKKHKAAKSVKKDDDTEENEETVEKTKLLVFVDDATMDYLQSYQDSNGDADPVQKQARLNDAKQAVAGLVAELTNPAAHAANQGISAGVDGEGDTKMNGENGDAEVVTIPLSADDELADIPAEMRETVAKEISAFRERSNRRDMERLRREEEIEAQDRDRRGGSPSGSRANSIPVGPREKHVPNAPLGPKGFGGSQMPRDYQKNVAFANGTGAHSWDDREDEDTDADDEELEQRRQARKTEEQEKEYLNQERKWLNRERTRTGAIERENQRDKEEQERRETLREKEGRRFREFNDDDEASRKALEYFADRSQWLRSRAQIRQREAHHDDVDRQAEERETMRERQQQDQARGMADDFLNRQAMELDSKDRSRQEPQRFKLSLGAAAQKAQTQAQSKKTVVEVESLLEDDEQDQNSTKRTLIPIKFDPADVQPMDADENNRKAKELAQEIPKEDDKKALWNWQIPWEHLDETVIAEKLRPWMDTKMLDILGVQDEFVSDLVETHLKKRGGPQDLVEQVEGPFDEQAESFVRGLWRRLIMFAEADKRGIRLN